MRWNRVGFLILCLLAGASAQAEEPNLELRGFQPPLDTQSSLVLEPVTTPRAGDFGASWLTSYAYRLVRILDQEGSVVAVPIRHQLSYDFLFNVGIGTRWALGLSAPGVWYQWGDRIDSDPWRAPVVALGDPSIEGKFVIVPKGQLGGYGLAAISRVGLPLASPESGLGDGAPIIQGRLLGELDLILLGIRASAGIRARTKERVFLGDQFGHSAPWAFGVVMRPQALGLDKQGRWQWFLDVHGALALTPEFATKHSSPLAIAASSRYALGGDVSLLAGVELPFNGALGIPSVRAVFGVSWAPRFLDADGDGIADDNDDCPEEMPEDRDGFEDDDGCPEDDNDNDMVPDAADRCPTQAEDLDGYEDEDGCPELDNDGDSIPDERDACPLVPGVASKSKKYLGCPPKDSDGDGILDDVDSCPDQPEDLDGRFDQDGCPDPDDDADGILDTADDCPTLRGPRRDLAQLNGCPDPDRDGDTYFGEFGDSHSWPELLGTEVGQRGTARDRCPEEPEDFDGDRDDDGCPDPEPGHSKPRPLVTFELSGEAGFVHLVRPISWESPTSTKLTPDAVNIVRALAKELRTFKTYTANVGIRPRSTQPQDVELAEARASHLVQVIQRLTLRDQSAKPSNFDDVSRAPKAQALGLGIALSSRTRSTSNRPGASANTAVQGGSKDQKKPGTAIRASSVPARPDGTGAKGQKPSKPASNDPTATPGSNPPGAKPD